MVFGQGLGNHLRRKPAHTTLSRSSGLFQLFGQFSTPRSNGIQGRQRRRYIAIEVLNTGRCEAIS